MAKTDVERDGRRTAWRNPVLRFEGSCRAPAELVYDLLADLQSHLEWAGQRQLETTRLLTLAAPPGPAGVGVEFLTTGSDGKVARWSDRSVVTEATRPGGVRVRHRRATARQARPPAVAGHGRPPLRNCSGGGRLPGDLHRRPHPPRRRALDPAHPRRQPDRVPDECQVHAARLRRPRRPGGGTGWNLALDRREQEAVVEAGRGRHRAPHSRCALDVTRWRPRRVGPVEPVTSRRIWYTVPGS